jgi:hypothetical protein
VSTILLTVLYGREKEVVAHGRILTAAIRRLTCVHVDLYILRHSIVGFPDSLEAISDTETRYVGLTHFRKSKVKDQIAVLPSRWPSFRGAQYAESCHTIDR